MGDKKAEPLLAKLRRAFQGEDRVPIFELIANGDEDIRAYGNLLFEKAYRTYTSKQWGIPPEQIDKSVLERVPMAMNYDARYLNRDFQYLPIKGYTALIENMLNHPKIRIRLGENAVNHIVFDERNRLISYDGHDVELLVFTGNIDELFGLKYGRLPYRSLDIRYTYENRKSILPEEIISYPQAEGYTRSTEYKKFTRGIDKDIPVSVIATEYPLEYNPDDNKANIPYYPVLTDESRALYAKYSEEAAKYKNIVLCGRLAEFKYYNMDICIEHALEKFNEIKDKSAATQP